MTKKKKIFALMMAICVVFSCVGIYISALNTYPCTCGEVNHVEVLTTIEYSNDQNPVRHTTWTFVDMFCKLCGEDWIASDYIYEPHVFEKEWNGGHYHKGSSHFFSYDYECTFCGYQEIVWESISCPGSNSGAGCILPYGLRPTPVEK